MKLRTEPVTAYKYITKGYCFINIMAARMFIDNVSGCSGFLALTGEQEHTGRQNYEQQQAADHPAVHR